MFNSELHVRGDLRVAVRKAATGEILRVYKGRNTVANAGLGALARLLAQNAYTLTDYQLAALNVGTDSTPATKTDTALGAQVFSIALSNGNRVVTTTGPYQVQVLTTLQAGDGNGNTLTEAGLFLTNGYLFARRVHPPIIKTIALVVDYDWRITLTA